MTRQITVTIAADGGTDRVLVPIVQWAIHNLDPTVEIIEPDFIKRRGSVRSFLQSYDRRSMLTFVHRDAEGVSWDERHREFENCDMAGIVPVIPVTMTEAWILFDASAISHAVACPDAVVEVPRISTVEELNDPKQIVEELLRQAAGNPTGRRRATLDRRLVESRINVASWIHDFSPLQELDAFRRFQEALARAYPYHVA